MTTDFGIATLEGSRLRRYFVDQTSSSSGPHISEANQQRVPVP